MDILFKQLNIKFMAIGYSSVILKPHFSTRFCIVGKQKAHADSNLSEVEKRSCLPGNGTMNLPDNLFLK